MPEIIITSDELSEDDSSEPSSTSLSEESSEAISISLGSNLVSGVIFEESDEESFDIEPITEASSSNAEPTRCDSLQKQLIVLSKTVGRSEGLAFWGAITLYQLMSMIAEGFTDKTVDLERNFARYQIPAIAIPTTLVASLHHSGLPKVNEIYRLMVSILSGSGSAAFNLLLSMEVITVIFRAIDSALKGNQVDISDALAWSDIAFCGVTGLGESLQVYYEQWNEANPETEPNLVNRVMTSRPMKGVYGGLNAAAAFHAASFVLMSALNSNSKLINTASEFYTRLAITLAAGIAGGYLLSLEDANERISAKAFKASVTLMQVLCLGFFAAGMYFLPEPLNTFGFDLRLEQLILWFLAEPLLSMVTALLATQCISHHEPTNQVDSDELLPVLDSATRPMTSYLSTQILPDRLMSMPNYSYRDSDDSDSDEELNVAPRFNSSFI